MFDISQDLNKVILDKEKIYDLDPWNYQWVYNLTYLIL